MGGCASIADMVVVGKLAVKGRAKKNKHINKTTDEKLYASKCDDRKQGCPSRSPGVYIDWKVALYWKFNI